MEQNTKHAERPTQVERQVEKKTYTHDIDSQKQANRQGMCVRQTEVIIFKAPRLGIHTPKCHAEVRPVEYLGNKFANLISDGPGPRPSEPMVILLCYMS